jgi:hypothetical protein
VPTDWIARTMPGGAVTVVVDRDEVRRIVARHRLPDNQRLSGPSWASVAVSEGWLYLTAHLTAAGAAVTVEWAELPAAVRLALDDARTDEMLCGETVLMPRHAPDQVNVYVNLRAGSGAVHVLVHYHSPRGRFWACPLPTEFWKTDVANPPA